MSTPDDSNLGSTRDVPAPMSVSSADERPATRLDTSTLGPATPGEHEPVPETPTRIGRFVVVRRVGAGAMGVVYSAYDEDLDRRLAVKVLSPGGGDESRMLREAQALARLSHPNVVQVYEVGRHGGRVFVAMEFVRGKTLRAWLRDEPRPTRDAILAVFIGAGRGLEAAHRARLVHRDFKPENVMVGEAEPAGDDATRSIDRRALVDRTRVLDFGIAWIGPPAGHLEEVEAVTGTDLEATDRLTRTGQFMGTPAYMSPEQIQGKPVDARSDQFSYCVALYEALHGQRPFDDRSFGDLVKNVIEGRVREPPRETKVPAAPRAVVLRGLQPDPGDRWPSMTALLEALADDPDARRRRRFALGGLLALAGLTTGAGAWALSSRTDRCAGAEAALDPVWSPARRRAIGAAMEASGSPIATATWDPTAEALDAYAAQWRATYRDACEANVRGEQSDTLLDLRMRCLDRRRRALDALLEVLGSGDAQVVTTAREAVASLDPLDRCSDLETLAAAVKPPSDPKIATAVEALRAEIEAVRADYRTGRYPAALAGIEQVRAHAEGVAYEPVHAEVDLLAGEIDDRLGRLPEATARYEDAFYAAQAGGDDEAAREAVLLLAGEVGLQRRMFDEAEPWIREADALVRRAGDPPRDRASLLAAEGGIRELQGRLTEAEQALLESARLREAIGDTALATTYNALGLVYERMERYGDAERAFRRTLEIRLASLGPDSPRVGHVLNNLGSLAQRQHRWDEAVDWYRQALANLERALGPEDPAVALPLVNIGDVERERGAPERALPMYERALAIDEKALGPDHRDLSYELTGLGQALVDLGRTDEAVAPLERALKLREANDFPPPAVAETRMALAEAVWATGRRARARSLAEQALTECEGLPDARAEVQAWLDAH